MLTIKKEEDPLQSKNLCKIIEKEESLSFVPIYKLKKSISKGTIYTIQLNSKKIGFIEICYFSRSWAGIFSFYIQEGSRNKHIGTKVMLTILKQLKFYNIYLATNSMPMTKICEKLRFNESSISDLPKNLLCKLLLKRLSAITNIQKLYRMQKKNKVKIFVKRNYLNQAIPALINSHSINGQYDKNINTNTS